MEPVAELYEHILLCGSDSACQELQFVKIEPKDVNF